VAALAKVFAKHGAFPLAEAFEGKDVAARAFGFTTVYGDWKKVSSHDDPRTPNFLERYFGAMKEWASGTAAKFIAYTLGDEWRDPFRSRRWSMGAPFGITGFHCRAIRITRIGRVSTRGRS
jgi:hypothetical protein